MFLITGKRRESLVRVMQPDGIFSTACNVIESSEPLLPDNFLLVTATRNKTDMLRARLSSALSQ